MILVQSMRSLKTLGIRMRQHEMNAKVISEFLEKMDMTEYFDSPKDICRLTTEELVSNTFKHTNNEEVELSIIKLPEYIGISVKDKTGELDREKVVAALVRGYQKKTPKQEGIGAGLGLYLTYENSNQLIVFTRPNVSTQIISVIESNKRYKKFKERVTSFHYYQRGEV